MYGLVVRYRGSALAVSSGLVYVLSNFWVGPFMGAVLRIFKGSFSLPVGSTFVLARRQGQMEANRVSRNS